MESGILGNENRRLQKDKMGSTVSEEQKCSITSPAVESNLLSLLAPQWDGTNSWRCREGARHPSSQSSCLHMATKGKSAGTPRHQWLFSQLSFLPNQHRVFSPALEQANVVPDKLSIKSLQNSTSHFTGNFTGMFSGRSQLCFSGSISGGFVP